MSTEDGDTRPMAENVDSSICGYRVDGYMVHATDVLTANAMSCSEWACFSDVQSRRYGSGLVFWMLYDMDRRNVSHYVRALICRISGGCFSNLTSLGGVNM